MVTNVQADELLRAPDAARYISMSKSFLSKARVYGTGPRFIKLSARAVAYRRSDLDAWIASRPSAISTTALDAETSAPSASRRGQAA